MENIDWKHKSGSCTPNIVAFEHELRRFTARYPEPLELQNWYPRGWFLPLLGLLAGSPPRPAVDRALQIRASVFRLQKRWPWLQPSVQLATFLLSRVSHDRTTMLVSAKSDGGQAFVDAFIRRCQELWDATPLSPVAEPNNAINEQPTRADAQKHKATGETSPHISSPAERKRRTAQLSTAEKLDRLRALRRDYLKADRVDIAFTTACNQVAIDPKTVLEHAPELRRRWDDPTYGG